MKLGGWILSALLACAACSRDGGSTAPETTARPDRSAIVTAPESVSAVATAEPGAIRNRWLAQTEQARTVTGTLTATLESGRGGPLVLAFANGITLRLERVADQVGADRTGSGATTFSSVLGADPNAGVYVYRVLNETITQSAARGGLCPGARTSFVAVSEFVNRQGNWVFTIAAYRGPVQPGPQSPSDPMYCGAYGYGVE